MKRQANRIGADVRPRIHIWMTPQGASFAFHPTAPRQSRMSVTEAFDAALDQIGHRSAVIMFEGVLE
jgi:hypothetical protein